MEKANELLKLIEEKKYQEYKKVVNELPEIDVAQWIEELQEEQMIIAFRALPKDLAADVFSYLSSDSQQLIINGITDKELKNIVEDLYIDDAVDMLDEAPANVVQRVLQNASNETRDLINQFLNYKEDTAGSIMTAEFLDLKKGMTVKEALDRIRRICKDKETSYTCYVLDKNRILEGMITVKTILMAKDEEMIDDLMDTQVIYTTTNEDKENVAKLLSKYDLFALPVVDNENRMVGIVTIDDAVDVIEDEATEDFEKMAAMLPSDRAYLESKVTTLFKNRIVWLIVLMISGIIVGEILGYYEAKIAAIPLLVTFVPMLNDTGGNCGNQSSTMVIRGLTTGDITTKDWLKVWWKEFRVSLLVSIVLASFNFIRIAFFTKAPEGVNVYMIAISVSGALFLTVILAKSVGGLLPILAKKLKLDPAVMAAPLITTLVDAAAIVIYFTFVSHLLF
ncbi:MAG TPA: magnesium transporter [Candidatus Caccosoma faecigallinarum]|uniref:Magnesium transporter MgtE n=1 Tax=Candidatus Caccosoma faecigallinarum TaxID=2840720 RepID=A0A9D1G8P3_9FIRM|nr:magnesium transporter [Candidatus Caccosoma faecigallinarum]